jgi:predicted component of type VI protein secretion system
MGKLVHFHDDGKAAEIRLDRQRITIGRRPDNDICLAYPAVSGEHAAVVTILADSFLEDLGSTNGTLVNGAAVTKHFLRDRDEIDIGQEILVYLADDAATLEAPPASVRRPRAARLDGNAAAAAPSARVGKSNVTGALRVKRRSDPVVPEATAAVPASLERSFAADFEGAAGPTTVAAPDAGIAVVPAPPPERQAGPVPALKVVDGAKAGRIVALVKEETLIGRTGVQVAALRRTAEEVRVVPVEGAHPPSVNGAPVAPEGRPLVAGDILEIAGTRLEVVAPTRGPSA